MESSELTPRQKTILRNRIEKNRQILIKKYGKRKYDKLKKVIDKIIEGG